MNAQGKKGLGFIILLSFLTAVSGAQVQIEKFTKPYEQVVEDTMKPFEGPSNPGVDASTLSGKVMCG